jgi:hypothetical protein
LQRFHLWQLTYSGQAVEIKRSARAMFAGLCRRRGVPW